MGSTAAARRAGMTVAKKATAARMRTTAPNVSGVGGGDAEQEAGHDASEGERADYAGGDADGGQLHALTDDERDDVGGLRAEGDAHADVVGAAGDQIRDDAEDSDGGEEQGEGGEGAEHGGREALAGERIVEAVLHGADVVDGDVTVDGMDFADDGGDERGGIRRGARHQEHAVRGMLAVREVDGDLALAVQAVLFDHSHHPGDRDGLLGIEPEVLSDGIVARPEAPGELFVDDGHRQAVAVVVFGEEAALAQGNLHGAEIIGAGDAHVHL